MSKLHFNKDLLDKYKPVLLPLLLLASILGLALITPGFLGLVEVLGKRIPQNNIRLDYVKGAFWAIFLGSTILFWPIRLSDKKALMWIWLVKCLVMLGFMLFYEHHYRLDSFNWFDINGLYIKSWREAFYRVVNFPVTFLVWLHYQVSLNSYHAIKVSFGMIGLISVYIFYRAMVAFLRQERIGLLYALAFFPSILFWGSILGKDPIVLFCIMIYCYGVVKWLKTSALSHGIILVLGVILIATIRPWWGFISGFPVFVVMLFNIHRKGILKQVLVLILLVLPIVYYSNRVMISFGLRPTKNFSDVANQKYRAFSEGGSVTNLDLKPRSLADETGESPRGRFKSAEDVILYLPWGMFTVLFRPFPGQVNNIFGLLAGLEGVFLLVLFTLVLMRSGKIKLNEPLVYWAILLTIIWSAAYALVGFNLGTVCRYRLQILPVFLCLITYLAFEGRGNKNIEI